MTKRVNWLWLDGLVGSDLFSGVMARYPQWHEGDAVTLFPGTDAV